MDFLRKYKIILLVIISILIIGTVIFFFPKGLSNNSSEQNEDCSNIPELENNAVRLVTKIIDGDTVLIEGGYSVRLLGIDADERGNPCYGIAKERLEGMVLNKEVRLELGNDNLDQWCRYLRYLFVDDKNIGLELTKEGLVVARASGENSKYQSEIALAEKSAIDNKVGCKWVAMERLI